MRDYRRASLAEVNQIALHIDVCSYYCVNQATCSMNQRADSLQRAKLADR